MPADRRPEHELLLLSARVQLDADGRARLRDLVATDLDWPLVTDTARRHGVAPLVYHVLVDTKTVRPDDERLRALRQRYFLNSGNSVMLTRELTGILLLLKNAGITAIPYKGPALAALLYGNLAVREFTDLDVLVRPKDALAAKDLLIGRGYQLEMPLTPAQARALVRAKAEYFLRLDREIRSGRVALELHWRIPATCPLDHDALWRRLQPVRILDQAWPHFAPEDLLLILCTHGFKHAWNTLKWIADVSQLITGTPLDWDDAIERARRQGGVRTILLGCAMAHAVLGTPLPPQVIERIERDRFVTSMTSHLTNHLFGRPLLRTGAINNFAIRERARDRVRYGLSLLAHLTVPTTAERATWAVPRGAGFVHYLAHPVRLAGRFARKYWA